MRALVWTAPGVVELQDVPAPEAGAGSTLVTVRAAGICGSELHGFRSVGFRTPPLVMGHEFAGLTPDGRRVVVNPLVTCGACDLCRRGRPEVCRERELIGAHRPGGFAEAVVVPDSALVPLPEEMSWEVAALVEPLANAVHAWKQVSLTVADRVAVIGAGAIGQVCLLVARHQGVEDVTVVDRSTTRLELAERLGAARCESELSGEYDVVVDAVGSAATRAASVDTLGPASTAVWLGLADPDAAFDGSDLVRMERRVVGSFAYDPEDFAEAVSLAPGLDLSWASAVPLEDSQRVFMQLADGASEPVKAVIRP